MSTVNNVQPTKESRAAAILQERFDKLGGFTVGRAQKALFIVMQNALNDPENNLLDDEDIYCLFNISEMMADVEKWQEEYPDPEDIQWKIRKSGIDSEKLAMAFIELFNRFDQMKFKEEYKETFRKLGEITVARYGQKPVLQHDAKS